MLVVAEILELDDCFVNGANNLRKNLLNLYGLSCLEEEGEDNINTASLVVGGRGTQLNPSSSLCCMDAWIVVVVAATYYFHPWYHQQLHHTQGSKCPKLGIVVILVVLHGHDNIAIVEFYAVPDMR